MPDMSMYVLENSKLTVKVKSQGAELVSIYAPHKDLEYLWNGDPEFWGRHAPVLFPIVGRLRNDQYQWNNTSYHMGQHGFARDMDFTLETHDKNIISFTLINSALTLDKFPFTFRLTITYKLNNNKLTTAYDIKNTGADILPFSIGAHPAFNCPVLKDSKFDEYYLEFSNIENCECHLLNNGLLTSNTEHLLNDTNRLDLAYSLFAKDAIVIKDLYSQSVKLKHKYKGSILQMEFPHFPFFGIWTKPNAPFLCLEPWHGIADPLDFNGEITEKEGIILLEQAESFKTEFSVTFLA